MDDSVRKQVLERAGHRCEYCRMPQRFDALVFEIEHVIAKQHGGRDDLGNRAAACFACNRHKGPNLSGVDPKTARKRGFSIPAATGGSGTSAGTARCSWAARPLVARPSLSWGSICRIAFGTVPS